MERLLTFQFGQPWWLLLLLLVPLAAWLQGRKGVTSSVRFSGIDALRKIGGGQRTSPGKWYMRLQLVALTLLILAMARPEIAQGNSDDQKEGIDIVLCIDVSGSMDSKDFSYQGKQISRREALVMAINEFVDHRPNDRFGMIGFAKYTYLMSPLTTDGEWIKNVLKEIRTQGGTAIGDGMLASIKLLKEGTGQSKVMIVVTDGQNNTGVSPLKAADEAAKEHVRVHTVGITQLRSVGGENAVKSMLGQVAAKTGGLYFQAANLDGMIDVYRQIDRMEKSKFKQKKYRVYDELYPWLVTPAFALLGFGLAALYTVWMRIP